MGPRAGFATILVAALAAAGCGGGSSAGAPATTGRYSVRETPSYDKAKAACGGMSREALARTLGLSTTDTVTIAKRYAERTAPLAQRGGVYNGCYAALTK